jgi:hypothetical protein
VSAVRDCLFTTFAATLHIGGRSSIRYLRTRLAMVIGTHLSWNDDYDDDDDDDDNNNNNNNNNNLREHCCHSSTVSAKRHL